MTAVFKLSKVAIDVRHRECWRSKIAGVSRGWRFKLSKLWRRELRFIEDFNTAFEDAQFAKTKANEKQKGQEKRKGKKACQERFDSLKRSRVRCGKASGRVR